MPSFKVSLLDYGAGNVRSVRNAITSNGYEIEDITDPKQIDEAKVLVFPGVGSYGSAMKVLHEKGYYEPLKKYLANYDRPFLGICLGMQTLFESSDEFSPDADHAIEGLGVVPGKVHKFDESKMAVPHIGWNGRIHHQESPVLKYVEPDEDVYFVHSYFAPFNDENKDWAMTTTTYGGQRFMSSIHKGSVVGCQFHPEKSGITGLRILKGFLEVSRPLINTLLQNLSAVGDYMLISCSEPLLFARQMKMARSTKPNRSRLTQMQPRTW